MRKGQRTVWGCFAVLLACGPGPDKPPVDSQAPVDSDAPTATTETGDTSDSADSGSTTSTATTESWADARVAFGGEVVCEDPIARASQPYDQRVDADYPNSFNWFHGGGIVVADFDADGYQDILTPNELGSAYYKGREGGLFDHVEDVALTALDLSFAVGGAAADYDGDGDMDAYIIRYQAPNVLLQNQGDGRLVQVNDGSPDTEAALCPGCPDGIGGSDIPPTASAAWGDFDRDGDLDLYVGNYGVPDQSGAIPTSDFGPAFPNYLYRNLGDGSFQDISDVLPQIVHDGYTYAGGWHDVDDDGWLDLLTVNDFGPAYPNTVMRNDEGSLVEGWRDHLWVETTGMGLGVADLNRDGYLDLLIPEYDKLSLWRSRVVVPDKEIWWLDVALSLSIYPNSTRDQMVGWGAEFGDVDNDADLDAVVAYGYIGTVHPNWENPATQPDAIYLQGEDGSFDDVAPLWGMADAGSSRGFTLADMNGDGYLDLLKRDLAGPNLMWMSRCGAESWLIVRPRMDEGANRFAVGSRVWVEADGLMHRGDVRAGGSGFASSGPPEVHIGLGDATAVDSLVIRWPDGERSRVEGVAVNQVVTVHKE